MIAAGIQPREPTVRWQMTNRFGIYLCRGSCYSEELGERNWPAAAIAAGRVLPILLVRLGLGENTHYLLALSQPSRLARLEDRRLGFEPLCQRKQSSLDTSALADGPAATLSCFDSQQFW
jgi:hypothetical protein